MDSKQSPRLCSDTRVLHDALVLFNTPALGSAPHAVRQGTGLCVPLCCSPHGSLLTLLLGWWRRRGCSNPSVGRALSPQIFEPLRWARVVVAGAYNQRWAGCRPRVCPSPSTGLATLSSASIPGDGSGLVSYASPRRVITLVFQPSSGLGTVFLGWARVVVSDPWFFRPFRRASVVVVPTQRWAGFRPCVVPGPLFRWNRCRWR